MAGRWRFCRKAGTFRVDVVRPQKAGKKALRDLDSGKTQIAGVSLLRDWLVDC